MDRKQLLGECFFLCCFLESIDTRDEQRVKKVLNALNEYSDEKLQEYYKINSDIKDIRVDRILKENGF